MDASSVWRSSVSWRADALGDGRALKAAGRAGAAPSRPYPSVLDGALGDTAFVGPYAPPVNDTAILGRRFPIIGGAALSGEHVRLPYDLLGAPALLLVAYRRQAHADVDRWATMASRKAPELRVVELPVVSALVWRLLQGWIDGGVRSAVPRPLWSDIVTVYDDGAVVRDFLGDPGIPVATALLLDPNGVVRAVEGNGFDDDAGERVLAALAAFPRA